MSRITVISSLHWGIVSRFGGTSKKTAWDMWKAYDEVTATFCALSATPSPSIVDDSLHLAAFRRSPI